MALSLERRSAGRSVPPWLKPGCMGRGPTLLLGTCAWLAFGASSTTPAQPLCLLLNKSTIQTLQLPEVLMGGLMIVFPTTAEPSRDTRRHPNGL